MKYSYLNLTATLSLSAKFACRLRLLLMLFCTSSWGATISSTFNTDNEGWVIADRTGFSLADLGNAIGTRSPSYFTTGGNPGGFIHGVDGPAWWWWRAPGQFLGNQAGAYGGSLSFDLISDLGIGDGYNVLVILESGGTRLIGTLPFFQTANTWTHFSIPLVAGSPWINSASQLPATSQEMTTVLANLTVLDINGEYGSGFDTGGLDNVSLPGCEPTSRALMSRFPESKDVFKLAFPFQQNVQEFLAALEAATDLDGTANPVVPNILETFRSPARAYLMHYANLVARGKIDASEVLQPSAVVPPVAELGDICWVHTDANGEPDDKASKAAADEMIKECCPSGIADAGAAYPSNHQFGTAIDMNIEWKGNLVIPVGGELAASVIGGPRDGGFNKDLHFIGDKYFGVIHWKGKKKDPAHWSIDGF